MTLMNKFLGLGKIVDFFIVKIYIYNREKTVWKYFFLVILIFVFIIFEAF